MELAYNEITKKDANGNYVYSSDIVTDIETKYAAMKVVAADLTKTINDVVEAYKEVYNVVLGYYPDHDFLAEKQEEEKVEEEEKDEGYNYTKYTSDDGNIIAVTYGDSDNNPYRTFILNYNFFDITTIYNGKTYTVPAFGYIIVD